MPRESLGFTGCLGASPGGAPPGCSSRAAQAAARCYHRGNSGATVLLSGAVRAWAVLARECARQQGRQGGGCAVRVHQCHDGPVSGAEERAGATVGPGRGARPGHRSNENVLLLVVVAGAAIGWLGWYTVSRAALAQAVHAGWWDVTVTHWIDQYGLVKGSFRDSQGKRVGHAHAHWSGKGFMVTLFGASYTDKGLLASGAEAASYARKAAEAFPTLSPKEHKAIGVALAGASRLWGPPPPAVWKAKPYVEPSREGYLVALQGVTGWPFSGRSNYLTMTADVERLRVSMASLHSSRPKAEQL